MQITLVSSPNLSALTLGGTAESAQLWLLEGTAFSVDGQYLTVRATFSDSADPVVNNSLRQKQGVWLYNINEQVYEVSINEMLAAKLNLNPREVNVHSAQMIEGPSGFIYATYSLPQAEQPLRLARIENGEVLDTHVLMTHLAGDPSVDFSIEAHAISLDGRFIAIQTSSEKLAQLDANGVSDIYLFDTALPGSVSRVSYIDGYEGPFPALLGNVITDGQSVHVSFSTESSLSAQDANQQLELAAQRTDAYLWSHSFNHQGLVGGPSLSLVSVTYGTGAASGLVDNTYSRPLVSTQGVLFTSSSPDINRDDDDDDGVLDVFFAGSASSGPIDLLTNVFDNPVHLLSTSRTGQHVAVLSQEVTVSADVINKLFLYDSRTDSHQLISQADHDVVSATVSPDGRFVAYTGGNPNLQFSEELALSGHLYLYASTDPEESFNNSPTGSVIISGTPKQGETLTASNTLADVDGLGTITYQWLADGIVIAGATGPNLVLSQAEVGKTISVTASYTDGFGKAESVTSAASAAVANINDLPTGAVLISGVIRQGETLTASNTLADADGIGVVGYQWLAGGIAIAGATGPTLVLGQAQVGKTIAVTASYTDGFGTSESVSSAATVAVENVNDLPTGEVLISGIAKQGETLTASNTLADADGIGVVGYQWLAGGIAIAGATGPTLVLGQAQVGKTIAVTASYTDGFGAFERVASAITAAVENVNDSPTGGVTIRGTAKQGQTLTAVSTLADADGMGVLQYQWLANGTPISGATSSSYLIGKSDVAKLISVRVTYIDGGGTSELITASSTKAVEPDVPSVALTVRAQAVESIGLTPDGKSLVIKTNGVSKTVSLDSVLQFSDKTSSAQELLKTIEPIAVFSSVINGQTQYVLPDRFTGPASLNLKYQLIDDTVNAVVTGSKDNDFIKLSNATSAGKAVDGGGGNDVIDGGVGSTFISGGGGNNVFFLDGRASGVSWSTITDFSIGTDKATIWGWKQGVSQVARVDELGGAPGYQGVTLHFENLLPSGASDADRNGSWNSITFSGKSLSDFGASSLEALNAQIAAGTNPFFITGQTVDEFGTHGYLHVA